MSKSLLFLLTIRDWQLAWLSGKPVKHTHTNRGKAEEVVFSLVALTNHPHLHYCLNCGRLCPDAASRFLC